MSAAKVSRIAGHVAQAADALNEAIDLFQSLGAVDRAAEAEAELARLDDQQ
ncbi:MAG TPA: hypothetical protein VL551_33445 [Actinospica sp.]|jgi:hypothetical protein|nr:hypothetical protein [Actinospica sp.]